MQCSEYKLHYICQAEMYFLVTSHYFALVWEIRSNTTEGADINVDGMEG